MMEWNGGDNPAWGEWVEVLLRSGVEQTGGAHEFMWLHSEYSPQADIVGYRVIQKPDSKREAGQSMGFAEGRRLAAMEMAIDAWKATGKLDMPLMQLAEAIDTFLKGKET